MTAGRRPRHGSRRAALNFPITSRGPRSFMAKSFAAARGDRRRRIRPLALAVSGPTGQAHVRFLRNHLRRAHAILAPALGELSLALVGDARMSALHAQFLGIDGPTDVLTFELDHDKAGRVTAGAVIVCVPHARR